MTWAAFNGHLPVVEYLVESAADMEAKHKVSDVIIRFETTPRSHMNILCVKCIRMDGLH